MTAHPLSTLAKQILNDEKLLRKFSDRIYQLLQEEIRNQHDRTPNWRRF